MVLRLPAFCQTEILSLSLFSYFFARPTFFVFLFCKSQTGFPLIVDIQIWFARGVTRGDIKTSVSLGYGIVHYIFRSYRRKSWYEREVAIAHAFSTWIIPISPLIPSGALRWCSMKSGQIDRIITRTQEINDSSLIRLNRRQADDAKAESLVQIQNKNRWLTLTKHKGFTFPRKVTLFGISHGRDWFTRLSWKRAIILDA